MNEDATAKSDAPDVQLPSRAGQVAKEQPELWAAFQALGAVTSSAGPLDEKSRRLVNLALAIGADSEGAVHSHARRGQAEGLSEEELEQVAYLAITTLGWPRAIRALSWIHDVTRGGHRGGGVRA